MVTNYAPAAIQFLIRQLGIYAGKSILDLSLSANSMAPTLRRTGAQVHSADYNKIDLEKTYLAHSFDVVIVAQCFERLDGPNVLESIYKILKPHGALALVWNARDESVHWFAQIGQLVRPFEQRAGRYPQMFWRDVFDRSPKFTRLEYERFQHRQEATPQDVLETIPDGGSLRAQVRCVLDSHRDTRGAKHLEVPYRTDVYHGTRL